MPGSCSLSLRRGAPERADHAVIMPQNGATRKGFASGRYGRGWTSRIDASRRARLHKSGIPAVSPVIAKGLRLRIQKFPMPGEILCLTETSSGLGECAMPTTRFKLGMDLGLAKRTATASAQAVTPDLSRTATGATPAFIEMESGATKDYFVTRNGKCFAGTHLIIELKGA